MHRRSGLTLVEMMVALALTIFMMAILSEAFATGLWAMSKMKALSDVEQRLKQVADVLRRDLSSPHFEGQRRLSELTASGLPIPSEMDPAQAPLYAPFRAVPPQLGFLRINEEPYRDPASTPEQTYIYEGQDLLGRVSARDVGDEIGFSVRLSGNSPGQFFEGTTFTPAPVNPAYAPLYALDSGSVNYMASRYDAPNNQRYTSQWAEIWYHLRADTTRLTGLNTGVATNLLTNTYNLHRRQLLLTPDTFTQGDFFFDTQAVFLTGMPGANFFQLNDVSAFLAGNGQCYINSPANVQFRARRFNQRDAAGINAGRIQPLAGTREGGDLLLTNVTSFDVKVWDPSALIQVVPAPPGGLIITRGAYVDIGFIPAGVPGTYDPYNASVVINGETYAWNPNSPFAHNTNNPINQRPAFPVPPTNNGRYFDTGTNRDGRTQNTAPGTTPLEPSMPQPTQVLLGPPTIGPVAPLAISSIQIKIRVYEPKSEQTREITIIVDM